MSIGTRTPWLGCVVLSDTNAHRLDTLLLALPSTQQPQISSNCPRCQYLVVGNDIDNAAAKLYIGNELVSTTFFGYKLVASQFIPLYSMEANLIRLDHVWVLTDTNPTTVNVTMVTR
jgi:hypothetical protein